MQLQQPLALNLVDEKTFTNFFTSSETEKVVSYLKTYTTEREHFVFLWGEAGVGKTHLLQALCLQAEKNNTLSFYLSLNAPYLTPDILQGLEHYQLIALDNLEAVAGMKAWEDALFHFYNQTQSANQKLIIAARHRPDWLKIALPDLLSRLQWGLTFQLKPLSDADKKTALCQRAKNRGMHLPDNCANYLLQQGPRDFNALFDLLDLLEKASLTNQRKLTIPFIRQFIVKFLKD